MIWPESMAVLDLMSVSRSFVFLTLSAFLPLTLVTDNLP